MAMTLLIVDDEVDLLEVLEFELQDRGYKIQKAQSGNEAMELLKTQSFDCILSDIRMPNGSGLDLLEFVNNLPNKIPFIFVTGFSSENDESIKGVLKTFAKPVDYDELTEFIKANIK